MIDRNNSLERARNYAPYLAESLDLFPELETGFRTDNPTHILARMKAELPDNIGTLDEEMATLRLYKRRVHLIIALSDIAEIWDWDAVTEQLTALADLAMQRLLRAIGAQENITGTPDNPIPGFFVLAVGKYGARELNYSSDIDFNVFYDPSIVDLPNPQRAERTLIRLVQALIKGFERITGDGYIFRTDLRLRPDPRSNAVAVSTRTAERYYETLGQNWERAAMIKARVCGGDYAAGGTFMHGVLEPFIWRRNLDYAAIEDILAMKRQIHAGKGGSLIAAPGHHLKLGMGGIREIEFYAQVQQLILGGRRPELRLRRTVDALAALAEGKFISPDDADALAHHYGVLRTLEHRTQMVRDEQTHEVPEGDTERESFAKLCGYAGCQDFDAALLEVLNDVHERYGALFPDVRSLSSREGTLVFTGVEPGPETLKTLKKLGYERGADVWRAMASWLGGRIRATKTERAREYLTEIAPGIIDMCADTKQPDRAFSAFARFFTGLSTGVSLLSMFKQTPERLSQLISLMNQSDFVADMLADQPAILDAMVSPEFLDIDASRMKADYEADICGAADFEDALNAARRRVREDHFRIITGILTQRIAPNRAAILFTEVADSVVSAMLPVAIAEVERISGPVRGSVAVLGLGKMGGREMRLLSDLDIMMIYQPAAHEENAQRLYTKVTQRLVSALSAVTEEGGLFEVDMALRPSGRSGPVAVTVEAFRTYYQSKAWTWEFMALTRARIVAASTHDFGSELSDVLKEALTMPRPDLNMPNDIADMLNRTKAEKPAKSEWDIKSVNGGLREIEFIAQSLFLKGRAEFGDLNGLSTTEMLHHAQAAGFIPETDRVVLAGTAQFYNDMSHILNVCHGKSFPETEAGIGRLAGAMGFENLKKFEAHYTARREAVSALTNRYIFNRKG